MVRGSLFLLLLVAGCRRQVAPAVHESSAPVSQGRIVEIQLLDQRDLHDPPLTLSPDEVAKWAGERLRLPVALGEIARSGIDHRLRIEFELAEAEEQRVLRAILRARLSRIGAAVDDTAVVSQVIAEREVPPGRSPGERAQRWQAHLERAVGDALVQLAAYVRVRLGSVPELGAGIRSSDRDLVVEAIRAAALRKERAVVPQLIERLRGNDGELSDRALGALVEIGDRRAVKPISDRAHFRDVLELPKVIDALAALGGDEARAYLEFVASGHDDPEVQRLARDGIVRMDRMIPQNLKPDRP